jgi:hypothetical protein
MEKVQKPSNPEKITNINSRENNSTIEEYLTRPKARMRSTTNHNVSNKINNSTYPST